MITPVNLESIGASVARSEADYETLRTFRDVNCAGTGDVVRRADKARNDDDDVLLAIERGNGASTNEIAESLSWYVSGGDPNKSRARRAIDRLRTRKLIELGRKGWKLTKRGHETAVEARADKHAAEAGARLAANLVGGAR